MFVSNSIYKGSFYLGDACLGLKEIGCNGRALYHHGDLAGGKVKVLNATEYQSLQCIGDPSNLFIFGEYHFQAESEGALSRVQIISDLDNKDPSSLLRLYIQGSLYRLVKAVTIFMIAFVTSPLWGLVLMGAYLDHPKKVSFQISKGWESGIYQLPIQASAPRRQEARATSCQYVP